MKKVLLVLSLFFLVGCSNDKKETSNSTATSTTDEITEEMIFDSYISKVESVNKDNIDSIEYEFYNYNDLLRYPDGNVDLKVHVINFEVIQVIENGKFTQLLGSMPNNDIFMGLIETDRLSTKILPGDTMHLYTQYLANYKYINNSDIEREVPLLYINAYKLLEQK